MIVGGPPKKSNEKEKSSPNKHKQAKQREMAKLALQQAIKDGTFGDLLWGKGWSKKKLLDNGLKAKKQGDEDEEEPMIDEIALWNSVLMARVFHTHSELAKQLLGKLYGHSSFNPEDIEGLLQQDSNKNSKPSTAGSMRLISTPQQSFQPPKRKMKKAANKRRDVGLETAMIGIGTKSRYRKGHNKAQQHQNNQQQQQQPNDTLPGSAGSTRSMGSSDGEAVFVTNESNDQSYDDYDDNNDDEEEEEDDEMAQARDILGQEEEQVNVISNQQTTSDKFDLLPNVAFVNSQSAAGSNLSLNSATTTTNNRPNSRPRKVSEIIKGTKRTNKRAMNKLSLNPETNDEEDDDEDEEEELDQFTIPEVDVHWGGISSKPGTAKDEKGNNSRPSSQPRKQSTDVLADLFSMSNELRLERESIKSRKSSSAGGSRPGSGNSVNSNHNEDDNNAFINRETTLKYSQQLEEFSQVCFFSFFFFVVTCCCMLCIIAMAMI